MTFRRRRHRNYSAREAVDFRIRTIAWNILFWPSVRM
jgi:hypothetical protein